MRVSLNSLLKLWMSLMTVLTRIQIKNLVEPVEQQHHKIGLIQQRFERLLVPAVPSGCFVQVAEEVLSAFALPAAVVAQLNQ